MGSCSARSRSGCPARASTPTPRPPTPSPPGVGLDRDECMHLREAGRLHEVGKLYVRRELLATSATSPSPVEREEVAAHLAAGYKLALGVGVPRRACEWILQCEERFDGGDDPTHPAGAEIPLGSRILAAACEYDRLARVH